MLAISRQVHAIAEQLRLAVFTQFVGDQQRAARQRLEDPHVDVVLDAPVEYGSRRRISGGHLLEVTLTDKRVGDTCGERFSKSARGPGKTLPDESNVILLVDLVLGVDLRIASQRQPGGENPRPSQRIRPIALGREDDVEPSAS